MILLPITRKYLRSIWQVILSIILFFVVRKIIAAVVVIDDVRGVVVVVCIIFGIAAVAVAANAAEC